jgi:NOL1/NOP2/fmu family ribosome biogenesis protein
MKCEECERTFDLFDETDAEEWFYGHDCETQETENN